MLLEDPAVTAAAVVVHRDDPTDPATARLDTCVVPAGGTAADLHGLRKRAAGILPEHMVPATVTALDALPLTPNGKLDATQLPAPVRSSSSARPAPEPDGTGDTALRRRPPGDLGDRPRHPRRPRR
ncbi:non-ribosomal peptide synthetase [Streptomyces californicus]